MKIETISYAELAKRVGDMVLFNNHNEVDDNWYEGLLEQPLLTEYLELVNNERREEREQEIAESKDEGEKAKLKEELESYFEETTVIDLASECYQTFAVTTYGAEYLINHTRELVSYSEKLGLFLWHIGHYGTSWTGVNVTVTDWEFEEKHDYIISHDEIMKLKTY